MTVRELLDRVLDTLPEERVRQVADFAMFLRWQDEDKEWHQWGLEILARAYGPDEPDYSALLSKPDKPS